MCPSQVDIISIVTAYAIWHQTPWSPCQICKNVLRIHWIIDSTWYKMDKAWLWWWHSMKMFSGPGSRCEGNPPVTAGFPSRRDSDMELWCCTLEDSLNKPLSKLSSCRWFQMFKCRHNNVKPEHAIKVKMFSVWYHYQFFNTSRTENIWLLVITFSVYVPHDNVFIMNRTSN